MSYFGWRTYVSVAEKRRQAERKLARLKKKGESVSPVTIEGRTIAKNFWGKSWCSNLERYSDYEIACRVAALMFATARLSTCKSPRVRSRQWSPAPNSTTSRFLLSR